VINLEEFLDNLNEKAIQALVWIGVAMWVVIFGSAAIYVVFNVDEPNAVVGYTEHGLPITKQDLDDMEEEDGK
jgi:hypothetical protein